MSRLVREMWDGWEDFSHQTERLIDLGDRIVSIQTIAGRGGASGVEAGARPALIWTAPGSRVVKVEVHGDEREALEAVGLVE